jgi:hypothetical protein
MTRAALLNGLRLIIAPAVMLSALPFPRAAPSFSGLAVSRTAHALVHARISDRIGHGHSHHDDDDLDPDHQPGHGSDHKDHSHVPLGLAAQPASLISPDVRGDFL